MPIVEGIVYSNLYVMLKVEFGRILIIEIIRMDIRQFNLLYQTTKIPFNKQTKIILKYLVLKQ